MGTVVNPTLFTPDYGTKPVTLLKGPVVSAISLVNKGANKKRFFLFKSEDGPVDTHGFYLDTNGEMYDPDDFSKTLSLIKAGPADDQWQAVYCVVAVPGEVDAQKDVWDEATIRDSAHEYLKKSRLVNYMHKDLDAVGELVESAIAPANMNVGGEHIPKGSWFIAIQPNPEMKKMIEAGEVTGVSVQGSSKREELDANHGMVLSMAKGAYDSAVVPRAVTQTDYDIPDSKENMEVPDGTEGPGIVALQHKLGIPETGKFDKLTKKAVQEWMSEKGVPGKPTLATIKFILTEEPKPVEAPQAPEAQAPTTDPQQAGQVQAEAPGDTTGQADPEVMKLLKSRGPIYHYNGDSSKTPLWVKELGADKVTVEFPPSMDGESEVAKVDLAEIFKCDNPDTHYEAMAKDYPAGPSSTGGAPYNPVDTSINYPSASNAAGLDSTNGPDPENQGTSPQNMEADSSDDELKVALIRALSNGNEILLRHLTNEYGINSPEQLQNYPFTQDELWGLVSRYVLGRMDNPPSESMMSQPVRRMDRSVYPDGAGFSMQKVAPFDYHTPDASTLDKNGQEITVGAAVKLSGGGLAIVSSVDTNTGEIRVEKVPLSGTGEITVVKGKSVECSEHDTPASYTKGISEEMGSMGEVLLKGAWTGSMGGNDPDAHGKIKYIVRSFGKWAHGKQHIAARKLLEHGVVKTPEAADRLAAWLKDQWMHSTKWREGNRGGHGIHKSLFSSAYEDLAKDHVEDSSAVDNEGVPPELSGEGLGGTFEAVCKECGHDPEEMQHMISENHHDLDSILDEEFGQAESEDLSPEDVQVAKSFISIMREEGELIEKLLGVEELLNKNQPNMRQANNKDFMAAMTALQLGIADAVGSDDLQKRESDLDAVLVDFSGWLQKFVEAGHYFDYESELEKNEPLEKGWLPQGTTKGDLADGDFAWISHDKNLPDSARRKMPYKVHGKVDPDGWKAAWGVANGGMGGMDTAGGPSIEAVKAKLLRDKPKDVNVNPDLKKSSDTSLEKKKCKTKLSKRLTKGMAPMDPNTEGTGDGGGSLKGATVQSPDGKKWLVIGQNGDSLTLRSGTESATKSAGEVKVVSQPMGKAMPPALAEALKRKRLGGAPAAPDASVPEGGAEAPPVADHTHEHQGEHVGPPKPPAEAEGHEGADAEGGEPPMHQANEAAAGAEAPEGAGSRLARLLDAARKKKAMMAGAGGPPAEEMMHKSAEPLTAAKIDRLRETRSFLESVLSYEAEAAPAEAAAEPHTEENNVSEAHAPEAEYNANNTEVEKDVEEETMSDSDVTMDQIVEAINGLGEEVDGILAQVQEFGTLGSKLDHIGDLAKSFDSTERIDVLEQAVERLTEALGVFTDTAESVETLTKRLTALEVQPGSSTAAPVDAGDHEVIAKSAPEDAPLFQRTWGSIF